MGKFMKPNYKKIYKDLIDKKYPEKKEVCKMLLNKHTWSALDVIAINKLIFEEKYIQKKRINQKHNAYNRSDILQILEYQRNNSLNNTQIAIYFALSRNTIAKWRKLFCKNGR